MCCVKMSSTRPSSAGFSGRCDRVAPSCGWSDFGGKGALAKPSYETAFLRFPTELAEHQRRPVSQALIVMLDGDHRGVAARMTELQDACREAGVPVRFPEDGVLVVVPTWRIETWLAYLDGECADESNRNYPRLSPSRDCAPHVDTLADMCRRRTLRQPAPDSLITACSEYGRWADSA